MAEETAEKPVVESFQLDHTKVKAPYVRYIDTETGPHGDVISNYDLRLTQPNKQAIPTGGLHTIEHTIAVLLRERIPGYIDCSPFGCRTGTIATTACSPPRNGPSRSLRKASAPTRSSARSSDRKPIGMEEPRPRIELRPGSWTWFINGT